MSAPIDTQDDLCQECEVYPSIPNRTVCHDCLRERMEQDNYEREHDER